jgi:hypothetical protein
MGAVDETAFQPHPVKNLTPDAKYPLEVPAKCRVIYQEIYRGIYHVISPGTSPVTSLAK